MTQYGHRQIAHSNHENQGHSHHQGVFQASGYCQCRADPQYLAEYGIVRPHSVQEG